MCSLESISDIDKQLHAASKRVDRNSPDAPDNGASACVSPLLLGTRLSSRSRCSQEACSQSPPQSPPHSPAISASAASSPYIRSNADDAGAASACAASCVSASASSDASAAVCGQLILPAQYQPLLNLLDTQRAMHLCKSTFEQSLASELSLTPVAAPLFVQRGLGTNDDLNGVEKAVSFEVPALHWQACEVVHSLAKWKRLALQEYDMKVGSGVLTNMRAIRACESLDSLHSLDVEQWDWECVISASDRTLSVLKQYVRGVYAALRHTQAVLLEAFPVLSQCACASDSSESGACTVLPEQITFIHAEQLQLKYPALTPLQRESLACKEHGAVFVVGIGGALPDGSIHDGRAPDYDDWSTATTQISVDGSTAAVQCHGLNGDLLVWNPVLNRAFELSSMGIRVDRDALLTQLRIRDCSGRAQLAWHQRLLRGELPQSIGGGVGQMRLCMYLLKKAHIGECQASIWPAEHVDACRKAGIPLLNCQS